MKSVLTSPDRERSRLMLALLTGALLALAQPPLPLGFLAWFAIVPLLVALERIQSNREAYLAGFVAGLAYYGGSVYWLAWNTGAPMGLRLGSTAGTILLLAAFLGLAILLQYRLWRAFGRSSHLLIALTWPTLETFWHHGELAFPWPMLALTQGEYLPVLQMAAVGGTAVVSAWVAVLNGVLAAGRERRSAGVVFLLLLGLVWGLGAIREGSVHRLTSGRPIARVALVQGNIDAAEKWDLGVMHSLNVYEPMTRQVADEDPDVVVWPETAAPVFVQQVPRWRHRFTAMMDSLEAALVTGGRYVRMSGEDRNPLNPAFLIRPGSDRPMERYDKIHLVPFGERVPGQWLIPQLGDLNMGQAEFVPGEEVKIWTIRGRYGTFRAAPHICYESIFPNLTRRAILEGAQVILNLTNDGWYDGTGELRQHLLLTRMRSVETGRSFVRSTNTGISAFIGPSGRLMQTLPAGVRAAMVQDIPPPVETPFVAWGWLVRYAMAAVLVMVFVAAEARLRKRKRRLS